MYVIKHYIFLFIQGILILALSPSAGDAQSISLSTTSASVLHDADEYFNDVLQSPKTFDSVCDPGMTGWMFDPYSVSNGIWTGVHPQKDTPQLGVLQITTVGSNTAIYREDYCSPLGTDKPVETSKFTNVAWRARYTSSSSIAFNWTNSLKEYAVKGFSDYDGFFLPGVGVQTPSLEWVVKDYNIPSKAASSFPWSGDVYGVTLFPAFYQAKGGQVSVDWIRLYDPNSDDALNLNWTFTGSSQSNDYVTLFVDTDNSGYDGAVVQRNLSVSGSLALGTGFLQPGNYYFYVKQTRHNDYAVVDRAQSAYIGPIRVNGKPLVRLTSPSRTSGKEYSRDVLGDPWDMSNEDDVTNLSPNIIQAFRGFHNWSFNNGYFYAETDADPDDNEETYEIDTQMNLKVAPAGINTKEYRYFCFNMQVETQYMPRDGNVKNLNRVGWFVRTHWQNNDVEDGFGTSTGLELAERSTTFPDYANGFTPICIDMWNSTTFDYGMGWKEMGVATAIRFDPLEATPATEFLVESLALYAENRNKDDETFNISWNVTDPEGDAVSVALYYGTDATGKSPGTLIATIPASAAATGSYTWNTAEVTKGTYYITAVANDGRNTGNFVSSVPVLVHEDPVPAPVPAPRGLKDPELQLTSIRPGIVYGTSPVRFRARVKDVRDIESVWAVVTGPNKKSEKVILPASSEDRIYVVNKRYTSKKKTTDSYSVQFFVQGKNGKKVSSKVTTLKVAPKKTKKKKAKK